MNDLTDSRNKIAEIDAKMAALFEERMRVVKDIAEYKQERGLSVKDTDREKTLIERNKTLVSDETIVPYYVNYIRHVIDISCSYQETLMSGMKVAYGGAEGAFAYIAARNMFPKARLISNHDFIDAYRSVEEGDCDCAVLPIENSVAGEVGEVMDLSLIHI